MLGQLAMMILIWTGMAFYFTEMNEVSKVIFYLVTSWLLFLIVIIVKMYIRQRTGKGNE